MSLALASWRHAVSWLSGACVSPTPQLWMEEGSRKWKYSCFGLCGDIVCWITYCFGLHRVCDVMTWCLGSGIGSGSGLMLIMPLQQIRVTPAEGKQKQAEKKQNISSPDAATKVRRVFFFFYFGVFCLLHFAPIITSFKTVLLSLSEQSVTCYPEMLEK